MHICVYNNIKIAGEIIAQSSYLFWSGCIQEDKNEFAQIYEKPCFVFVS